MPKRRLKKQSRRMTTKRASKIAKKVREHKRKARKAQKQNPVKASRHNAVLRDPGLPGQMPFKEQILHEAELESIKRPLIREEKRQEWKKTRELKEKYSRTQGSESIHSGLETGADKRSNKPSRYQEKKKEREKKRDKLQSQGQVKAFHKVIEQADVVIEVLDARDPLGTRCQELEESVQASGAHKRLVLLLNKIDLIPRENLESWLKYLRNEYPTVPFKSSTQLQRNNLKQAKGKVQNMPEKLIKSRGCVGSDSLIQLLNNYSRNKNLQKKITVGVVGYPNTGKSSVINSLKRGRACRVGSVPGVTKCQQLVYLDRHTWLLDSPGVVLSRDKSTLSAIINNCINIKDLKCPERPVEAILKRSNKQQMMARYMIADYSDGNEFLALVAKRLGFLKKNGVPNRDQAARCFLHDWNVGRIRYFTHPPKRIVDETHEKSEIVAKLSKPFDLDSVLKDEQENLNLIRKTNSISVGIYSGDITKETKMDTGDGSGNDKPSSDAPNFKAADGDVDSENVNLVTLEGEQTSIPTETDGYSNNGKADDLSCENMEHDTEISEMIKETDEWKGDNLDMASKNLVVEVPRLSSKTAASSTAVKRKMVAEEQLSGNRQLNKNVKKNFKKMRKERKRSDVVSKTLSEAMDSAFDVEKTICDDEDYDFKRDFVL